MSTATIVDDGHATGGERHVGLLAPQKGVVVAVNPRGIERVGASGLVFTAAPVVSTPSAPVASAP